MRQRKAKGLLVLGALALAFVAAPAAAQTTTIYEFVSPAPPVPPEAVQYCYTEAGHWMWDGFQYVWMPGETVCSSS